MVKINLGKLRVGDTIESKQAFMPALSPAGVSFRLDRIEGDGARVFTGSYQGIPVGVFAARERGAKVEWTRRVPPKKEQIGASNG
jgi:hypothetical protein